MKISEIKERHLVIIVILLALLLRLVLIHTYGNFNEMNPDEEKNYKIATNYLAGEGYTIDGKATAFHGTFPVFVYRFIQKHNLSKEIWTGFIHYFSILVFVISIFAFFKLLKLIGVNQALTISATVIYAFYPSNVYYIGNFFLYEKLVLPLFVIVFYFFIRIINYQSKFSLPLIILLASAITISCLFRAQLIFIYFGLFLTGGTIYLYKLKGKTNRVTFFSLYILTATLMICSHIPILIKNKEVFDAYILSTQVGFELMQGHNDLARGSWYGNWQHPNSEYYKYSHDLIPNIDSLNEYEESEKRKEVALTWIKENPIKELELTARKLAIFFLPQNYEAGFNVMK